MVEGKVTCPPSVGENLYLSLRKALHNTTHLLLGFNEIEELYHYEFIGWDGLWLLKIADLHFLI